MCAVPCSFSLFVTSVRPLVAPPCFPVVMCVSHNCTHSNQLPIGDHRYSNSHKHDFTTVVSFCLTAALAQANVGDPQLGGRTTTARTVVGYRIGVSPLNLIAGF